MSSSSSSNQFTNFYGHQQQPTNNSLGMGSLQNLSRNPLSQLARGGSNPVGGLTNPGGGGGGGFNSTVGGDRLTPTTGIGGSSGGGSGGGYPSPISQPNRQSTLGMNLLQSSSVSSNRNPLFNRDRSKIDSGLSPNTFDHSEFPSLGNRDNSAPNPSLSARPNYVGMVKQPAMETSEFTMSNEDFPALPGYKPPSSHELAQQNNSTSGSGTIGGPPGLSGPPGNNNSMSLGSMGANGLNNTSLQSARLNASQGLFNDTSSNNQPSNASPAAAPGGQLGTIGDHQTAAAVAAAQQQLQQSRGIITSPDGLVTNIPGSMVTDQFGMIGLLTFIRAAETDPNLVSLALGADLTTLGLNLNSEVNLYPTFAGPWADTPCRPQDIDYHVPQEYLTNTSIRDKLAPVKLNRYKDDVLFYMFYTNVGDVLQLAAAAELYSRDWRFHKDGRVWITRAPGMAPTEKTSSYERGTYYFFDVTNWRKVSKDFHLDYDKLEDRPSLPSSLTGGAAGGNGTSNSSASPAPTSSIPSTNGPSSSGALPMSAGNGNSPIAPNLPPSASDSRMPIGGGGSVTLGAS